MFPFSKKKHNAQVGSLLATTPPPTRWQLLFALILLLSSFQFAQAQQSVALSSNTLGANNCGDRTLTAVVTNGSGFYSYFWNSNPSSSANLGNGPSITVRPSNYTTFGVGVFDQVTGVFMQASVAVFPVISGDFIITNPPNVITPNGDGLNDFWQVRGLYNSNTPINAYGWSLSISSARWGNRVYQSSYTDTNSGSGIIGGQITWDGSGVSDGTYNYSLTLYNCSKSQTYYGSIDVYGSGRRMASSTAEPLAVYPNPATDELLITPALLMQKEVVVQDKASRKPETAASGPYEIKLVDKFNQVRKSITSQEAQTKLDVSTLPEGTYFLQVTQGAETARKQIVIKH